MKKLFTTLSLLALSAGPALAGNYKPPVRVPEIDATQGLAAIAVLVSLALLVREHMVRRAEAQH
jgi:hypothetical protein